MTASLVLATDSPEPSGVGEHMVTLGRALQGQFAVTVACPAHDEGMALLRRAARAGLRVKSIDIGRPAELTGWLAANASLLHVHAGIGWEGHSLVRCGKAAGLPVVRTEHLPYLLTRPVQKAEYRAMLLSVDCRIAVSKAVLDSHAGQGKGRHMVVHNGITHQAAQPLSPERRRELGLKDGDRLILTIARFTAQKGHATLVAAASRLREHLGDVKFVLVGKGPERQAVERLIAEHDLTDKFVLMERVDNVGELLTAAEMFVLPSHFEGLPLVLLEAMAVGLPIVATRIGGTMEALGENHPSLVPAGDAGALADAILRTLENAGEAADSAEHARQRLSSNFTADRMASRTAAIYSSLLSAGRAAGVAHP